MFSAVAMHGTMLRDLHARERTLLAYVRTSGYLFLAGMAVSKLFEGDVVQIAAVVFVVAGMVLTVVGIVSFVRFCVCIRYGVYVEMSILGAWSVTALAVVVAGVTVALLVEGG